MQTDSAHRNESISALLQGKRVQSGVAYIHHPFKTHLHHTVRRRPLGDGYTLSSGTAKRHALIARPWIVSGTRDLEACVATTLLQSTNSDQSKWDGG